MKLCDAAQILKVPLRGGVCLGQLIGQNSIGLRLRVVPASFAVILPKRTKQTNWLEPMARLRKAPKKAGVRRDLPSQRGLAKETLCLFARMQSLVCKILESAPLMVWQAQRDLAWSEGKLDSKRHTVDIVPKKNRGIDKKSTRSPVLWNRKWKDDTREQNRSRCSLRGNLETW